MNLFSAFCRPALLLLFVTLAFTACKKENDTPNPDLGARVAGQYTLSEITINGKVYPASGSNLKGGVSVTRLTASSVQLDIDINQKTDGSPFINGAVDDVSLTDAGSGDVTLTKDGENVGRSTQNKLILNGVDDSNTRFTITLTK